MNARHPLYLNPKLRDVKSRCESMSISFAAGITKTCERYERMLYLSIPEIEKAALHEFRRFMASVGPLFDIPFMQPKMLAAMVESSVDLSTHDEDSIRATYAAARAISGMSEVQAMALIEVTERWVRARGSTSADPIDAQIQ